MIEVFRHYYRLAKPGIVYGNALHFTAGFFLASRGTYAWGVFAEALLGLSCIVASGAVLNNIFDRGIDAKMNRTKNRAIPRGDVSIWHAYVYAGLLGGTGVAVLMVSQQWLVLTLALAGAVVYLGCYTPLKRYTFLAAEAGTLSGAVPPLAGYVSVTQAVTTEGLLLFLVVALWQMPHFLALAIRMREEYAGAGIPILPVRAGVARTVLHIAVYAVLYVVAVWALGYVAHANAWYYLVIGSAALVFALLAVRGMWVRDTGRFSRYMFSFSLVLSLLLCFALMLQR